MKSRKSGLRNPDLSNPNFSNPYPIHLSENSEKHLEQQQIEIDGLIDVIKAQIDYDILLHDNPHDINQLDEIVSIMLNVLISKEESLLVGGIKTPRYLVHQNFLKLRHEHIEYIFESLQNTGADIRNIRAYLLTTLYNAPLTIDNYYTQRVRHDIENSKFTPHTEQ